MCRPIYLALGESITTEIWYRTRFSNIAIGIICNGRSPFNIASLTLSKLLSSLHSSTIHQTIDPYPISTASLKYWKNLFVYVFNLTSLHHQLAISTQTNQLTAAITLLQQLSSGPSIRSISLPTLLNPLLLFL